MVECLIAKGELVKARRGNEQHVSSDDAKRLRTLARTLRIGREDETPSYTDDRLTADVVAAQIHYEAGDYEEAVRLTSFTEDESFQRVNDEVGPVQALNNTRVLEAALTRGRQNNYILRGLPS